MSPRDHTADRSEGVRGGHAKLLEALKAVAICEAIAMMDAHTPAS